MALTKNSALDWLLEQLAWECTLARLRARAQLPSETSPIEPVPMEPCPAETRGRASARSYGAEDAQQVRGRSAMGRTTALLFAGLAVVAAGCGSSSQPESTEDLPGNFLLVPPGSTLDGVNAGTSDDVGVYQARRGAMF
jgi:hypothetical protein